MKKTFLLTTLILSQICSFGQNSIQEKTQTHRKANEHLVPVVGVPLTN